MMATSGEQLQFDDRGAPLAPRIDRSARARGRQGVQVSPLQQQPFLQQPAISPLFGGITSTSSNPDTQTQSHTDTELEDDTPDHLVFDDFLLRTPSPEPQQIVQSHQQTMLQTSHFSMQSSQSTTIFDILDTPPSTPPTMPANNNFSFRQNGYPVFGFLARNPHQDSHQTIPVIIQNA